jgi:hypothetical protein
MRVRNVVGVRGTLRSPQKQLLSFTVAAALALTSLFAGAVSPRDGAVYAADAAAARSAYPWSPRAATGDYFYDSYDGVARGSVFENVTTDRLLDILSSNGNYYIVFAGPEHDSSQAILAAIDARAGAKGIDKIYHFDPYVDGYQLDITQKKAGVPDVLGGKSVNFGDTAKISDVWRLITQLLPSSAVAPGGALYDYDGKDTLLFNVRITDRGSVETGKVIVSRYKLTEASANAGGFDPSFETPGIDAVLSGGKADARSEWEFFKRVYNGSASYLEKRFYEYADRIGAAVELFSESDFPKGAGFTLDSVDVKELYDLLNSPGEFPVLFAGVGCHNTQAVIGEVAKRAKQLGVAKVYVLDLSLDSNVKFGTGSAIDAVVHNGATSGLWIRSFDLDASSSSSYQYGYTYLYGYLAGYFGDGWVTEDSSRKENSVPYFIDGVLGGEQTVSPYYKGGDNPDLRPADTPNAKWLQAPTLLRYNKDAEDGPVVAHWLHANTNLINGKPGTYTEYMLELAWTRQTAAAKADASRNVTGRDGLTKTEFAAEAIAALDGVLKPGKSVTYSFTRTPAPTIAGNVVIGATLTANTGDWSHAPVFAYQWYAGGKKIAGATTNTYTLKASDAGKAITVSVTGSRKGYASVTKTSAAKVAGSSGPSGSSGQQKVGSFTKAPTPVIKGEAKLGVTFGLNWGSWSPWPAGSKFSFQWYRNGQKISGATNNTYKIVVADVGARITAEVTATAPGYTPTSRRSAPTAVIKGYSFRKAPAPKITGTAKVGKTLKVKVGAWSPKAKYSYQWYANGKAIKKATKSSLKLKKAQKGKKITVAVTAKKAGYEPKTKKSKATKKVKK